MERQLAVLKDLLKDNLDRVGVIHNLNKLKVEYDHEAPFVILKYKLQLEILEIIIKENANSVYYSKLKKETEDYLEFHNQRLKKTDFKCCLAGCLFHCRKHRDYIRHLKRFHSKETNFICQFGLFCSRASSSLDILLEHIQQVHCSLPPTRDKPMHQVDIPCRCVMVRCMGTHFSNTKSLMLHMRKHHESETVECIFQNCNKKFLNSNSNTLRCHFYEKHQKVKLMKLKDANRFDTHPTNSLILTEYVAEEVEERIESEDLASGSFYEGNFDDDFEDEEENLEEETETNFLMSYCDFLNRLANFQFIPQSTIQIIGEEYLENYQKSNQEKAKNLRISLRKNPDISESEIQRIIGDVEKNDTFLEAQTKLNSEYKRVEFLKDNFNYVAPQEIVLNPKQVEDKKAPKDVVHYVSIIDTFKNLIQDSTYNEMVESSDPNKENDKVKDVKDGELYKTNSFFNKNPGAFTMMLYSDAIELVNPLGAGRGKHKVIQIFFTLAEIPKRQRSKIDRIQLVAVFKEKLVQKYGFKKIYSKIVDDLKVLESGVSVNYPVKRIVKCGLLIHPADNLEE